ncbi:MAG: Flp pilus assembly complex ATPase component TadA [Desulfobacteraceae bacterium]|nr:Flp pilus assembly complex ATPase component TadA [Desulfobacteraceae bacterium]
MLLGQLLIKQYNIKPEDIEKALQFQERFGGLIGGILLNMGIISEETLVNALSEHLNLIKAEDIDPEEYDSSAFSESGFINETFLVKRHWIPVGEKADIFYFAALNPLDYEVMQYLQDFESPWKVLIATETYLRELETRFNMKKSQSEIEDFDFSGMMETEIDKLKELASEAPVVNLVNSLISRAVVRGASDLHFEPYKNMCRVRFRIDGKLHDIDFLPLNMQLPVASRIKILSGMDIAERRRPQDGQITMKVASRDIDIRVSTLPLAEGESLVLRFLLKESVGYVLEHLGFEANLEKQLNSDISKTSGVILLTGPTGSGKTTTLYSCLNRINSEDKKIITIENPVEYQLDGINQINVNPDIDYNFLTALRSILRQDPDILMVGEIRDGETARVAMQSSLTGHLVFSTIHTNDAVTAYTRLIDLGIEEYLINSSLISVIAQRLVRKVCPDCAGTYQPDPGMIETYDLENIAERSGISSLTLKKPNGCSACNQTGYKGRVAILEYLQCTPYIKSLPKDTDFPLKASAYMEENGIRTLKQDGLLKVVKGITTIDEVARVCG